MSYFMKSVQDYAKNLTLSNVPEYFVKKKDDGDSKSGVISFKTSELDDTYGEIASFEIRWVDTNPIRYHVGKDSTMVMNEFIEIGVGFSKKEHMKINGHDAYYMLGARREAKQGRLYVTNYVIVCFCCDVTKRRFKVKFSVFKDNFENMEEHIKGIVEGILCH